MGRRAATAALSTAFLTAAATVATVATLRAQDEPFDFDAAPVVSQNATTAELLEFQARWTQAEKSVDPADAARFFEKKEAAFYESTKALLSRELDPEERAKYSEQFAQILASQALREAFVAREDAENQENSDASTDAKIESKPDSDAPTLGAKYDELTALATEAFRRCEADPTDENRAAFLSFVDATFAVRFRFARLLPEKQRDDAFAALVSDSISFALAYPENGEKAFELVLSIRSSSPELGDEALDALDEAFERSPKPVLTDSIRTFFGRRRFARLPGNELKFEGLLLNDGKFDKKFDRNDYRGKILLIEFWATWCGPCRKEFPRLKETYAKYRERGFEIIGYSVDQDVERLKTFVAENELPWPIVSQTESVAAGCVGLYDYYAINGVPELILIGRDGAVVLTDARGEKLTEALEKIFAEEDATAAESEK